MATEKVKATVKKEVAPKATATVKANALKTDIVETKVAEVKTEAKKAAETTKKTAVKAATATKEVAKKAAGATKKTVAKATKEVAPKKVAAKTNVTLEYADKKYTTADLEKIASDVWVYDYGKKASELKTVELYVKPFESRVYYVFNGDVVGSFQI